FEHQLDVPADIAGPQETNTALASTPNPSAFGQLATFTATVTAKKGGSAASGGSVTFIEGGTCAAPSATLAASVALDEGGQASFSTGALTIGSHTLVACYGGGENFLLSEGSADHTVDPAVSVTSLVVSPSSQQYSDRVTLSATVTPATVNGSAAAGTVQFRINGNNVGSPVALGTGGLASLSDVQVTLGQGSYQTDAAFTSTSSSFNGSTGSASLTVTREDATVLYDAANDAALQVSSPGGALNAAALSLAIGVKENEPDVATSPGTTGIGNVANAGMTVTLVPVGPGSAYTLTCTPTGVSGSGYAAVRGFTCTNPGAIAVNAYEVQVTVTGDYYIATYSDAFTVFDPSLGFVTGGGTYTMNGDRVRFGITTKYKKNGDGAKGSLIVVRRHPDGTTSSLTSNALAGLALGVDATVPMGWAALSGKATYTTWDATAHGYVTTGGQSFTVYVEDRGDPGTGVDRIWVGGPATLSLPGSPATARSNAVTIAGGNISVPHNGP
ncbi:MAG: Ig-like domain-containing protein, partial [Gemmatimonadaceae bacterium]